MDTAIAMALIAATNPVRLGFALLLISRPRPMFNLFAFWLGAMTTAITAGMGVLTVVHYFAPASMQSMPGLTEDATARHAQIAVGVALLAVTALIAVGSSVRRARVPVASGDRWDEAPRPSAPGGFARVRARIQELLTGDHVSVAFVLGLGSGFPAVEYPVALAAIAASAGSLGGQFSAVLVFVAVMLLVIEIPLVSYSAMPAQTQAVMLRLHDWALPRRWQILGIIVAAEAVWMVATGLVNS
jgi:Sap, sulfolipid-1-addressing protein